MILFNWNLRDLEICYVYLICMSKIAGTNTRIKATAALVSLQSGRRLYSKTLATDFYYKSQMERNKNNRLALHFFLLLLKIWCCCYCFFFFFIPSFHNKYSNWLIYAKLKRNPYSLFGIPIIGYIIHFLMITHTRMPLCSRNV